MTSEQTMEQPTLKRAFAETEETAPVEWSQIMDLLKQLEDVRKAELENMTSIQRLHAKIKKNLAENWTVKSAKKCKRLYAAAMDKARQQTQLIESIKLKIIDYSAANDGKKKRKPEEQSAARYAAAKIKKEGAQMWILGIIRRQTPDAPGFFEIEDAETDADSPDFKRRYVLPSASFIELLKEPRSFFPVGSSVLALYPDTSCFYKAQVIEAALPGNLVYTCKFEDDNNQLRKIPAKHVVALPKQ